MAGRRRKFVIGIAAMILIAGATALALRIYRVAEDRRGVRLAADGYSAFVRGDYDTALRNYNASLTHWMSEPHRGLVFSGRSGVYVYRRDFDAAIRDLTQAINKLPSVPENFANRGGAYLEKGDTDRAIADYSKAIALNSNYAGVFFKRSKIFLERGKVDAALADINEAVRCAPDNAEALIQRGLVYERKGDLASAIASFESAQQVDPNDKLRQHDYVEQLIGHVLLNRGIAADRERHYEEAIAFYTDALRHHPTWDNQRAILCDRGNVYGHVGQPGKAALDYEEAIRLDPKFTEAYFNRGLSYRELGQIDKAMADYSEAIRLNPRFVPAYISRAACFVRRGEFAKANADYDEGLHNIDQLEAGKRPALLNDVAWMWATSSKPSLRNGKQALKQATKSCEMTQWKNADYVETLAAACAESGDFDRAVKMQLEAMRINGESDDEYRQMKKRLELYQHRQPYHVPAKD